MTAPRDVTQPTDVTVTDVSVDAVVATNAERLTCVRCEVQYRAERTDGECPICGEQAPGGAGRRPDDGLDLRSLIVLGMSAANLLALAVLAAVLLA